MTGDSVVLQAGRDLVASGAVIDGVSGVSLIADRDIRLGAHKVEHWSEASGWSVGVDIPVISSLAEGLTEGHGVGAIAQSVAREVPLYAAADDMASADSPVAVV